MRIGQMTVEIGAFEQLDGWAQDDHRAALTAFLTTCDSAAARASSLPVGGTAADWAPICAAAPMATDARSFFERFFTPVVIGPDTEALITGYFEPELAARRAPGGAFQYPIHRRPPELEVRDGAYGVATSSGFRPLASRAEIAQGALANRGLEIAYLNDPVDAFFLQIQGSGRLRFADDTVVRVGFDGRNGHTYSSVGRAMIDRGWATEDTASADRIREFYAADPVRGQQLLNANASYVFFIERPELDAAAGPIGALGRSITARRSIAVDRRFTPLGAPVWLETTSAVGPLQRLVVAQDTGSAILGAQRADFYWGSGPEAGRLAGRMRNAGRLTTLLPTTLVDRWRASDPGAG